MLKFREAQKLIASYAHSLGKEKVLLDSALGRVLAEPVVSDRDYPPFNRVAMDGYAIRLKDFQSGLRSFEVVETIYAGQLATKTIASGQCYKIMTGAPLPSFADVVIRREDTEEKGGVVQFHTSELRAFQNIAQQGEDVKAGKVVIDGSFRITPAIITALASLGKPEILVEKLPKVALFTTGDEVVAVGEPVLPQQIRNSNAHLLKALLKEWGISPVHLAHIADMEEALVETLGSALDCDLIIMSGGVSAGDADYVPKVLEALGVKKLFHKIAIRPGKPIWCGLLPNGGMVFALPGNPLSCHVTFKLFIENYLSHLFGIGATKELLFPISGQRKKKTPLDEFFPIKMQEAPVAAIPLEFNGSGDVLAALQADAFALQPADSMNLENGDMVSCFIL